MTAAMMPETYDDASAMLASMKSRRSDLSRLIEDSATKRRDIALAVQLGSDDHALREHDKTVAAAEAERINLNSAIEAMATCAEKLRAAEEKTATANAEANRIKTIDELLALDDKIDDALDGVRDLLKRRRDLISSNWKALDRAVRSDGIAGALLSYFDELFSYNPAQVPYSRIMRIADRDAKYLKRTSPRMTERGPRPLTTFDKIFMNHSMSPLPMQVSGKDSVIENEKFHAARGAKPERYEHGFDVSGGMMRNVGR